MLKKIILFTSCVALVSNLVAGLLLSAYHPFNLIATSVAIILTAALLYAVAVLSLKDAFRISLTFLYSFIGIVIFLLLLFAKPQLQDNWCIIASTLLVLMECAIVFVVAKVSQHH